VGNAENPGYNDIRASCACSQSFPHYPTLENLTPIMGAITILVYDKGEVHRV
jgi:hypothetical protein